jgi:hypothetical protein
MPESRGNAPERTGDVPSIVSGLRQSLLMRISVPSNGELREIASDVAAKIAEYLGMHSADPGAIAAAVDGLAGTVAPPGGSSDITFEFHAVKGELVVQARCDGRSSETRHRLRT